MEIREIFMIKKSFLGIFREEAHSPNRVSDDYEILRLSAEKLALKGLQVQTLHPQAVLQNVPARPDVAFIMCEQEKILALIQRWENEGTRVVNSIDAIYNTYRYRMIPLLQNSAVQMPKSQLFNVQELLNGALKIERKIWMKRGDVHNTQAGDVVRVSTDETARAALMHFAKHGIAQVVFQDHIEGDLIKFYGVGDVQKSAQDFWFRHFYHRDQTLKNYVFDERELQKQVGLTAQKLGLCVFGGDAVIDEKGKIYIIDINAWPSFALFRQEASQAIADFIASPN